MDNILNTHHQLCNASKKLNVVYGVQILTVLLISFIGLLSQIYSLIVISLQETDEFIGAIFASAAYFFKFFIILEACTQIQTAANFTRVILHRLRNFNHTVKEAV